MSDGAEASTDIVCVLRCTDMSGVLICRQKWEQESSVKLVIIKGAGGKAFCCGGDVRGNC